MSEAKIRAELKMILENVAFLGSRDPWTEAYQKQMIDHMVDVIKAETVAKRN